MRKQTQGSLLLVGMIAGGVGFVAFVALMVLGGVNFSPALFFAIVVAGGAGTVLFFAMHSKSAPVGLVHPDQPRPSPAKRHGDRTLRAGSAGVVPGSAGVVPGSAGVKAGGGLLAAKIPGDLPSRGQAVPDATGETAGAAPRAATGGMPDPARGGAEGHEADVGLSGTPQRAADEPRGATLADPHGPEASEDRSGPAPETVTAPDRTTPITAETSGGDESATASAPGPGDVIGTEPPRLDAPREGGADDLKRLNGVGPKIEGTLNELGIYHFDQIAKWSPGQIAWVDERIEGVHGRIERDDWVGQAQALSGTRGG